MVVSTCRQCKNKHLIADNELKMDMAQFGRKIEEYLIGKGERVQRLTISAQELEQNYLVDEDGELKLVSKMGGQVCCSGLTRVTEISSHSYIPSLLCLFDCLYNSPAVSRYQHRRIPYAEELNR
jgi:DNL zinc finger